MILNFAPSSPQKANKNIHIKKTLTGLIDYGIKYIKYVCNNCGFTSMSKRTKKDLYK